MKKVLMLVMLLCVFAVSGLGNEPFLTLEFSHNATNNTKIGDKIDCVVSVSEIKAPGISSFEFNVAISDGLAFNNDETSEGLEKPWAVWAPNTNTEGLVKFAVVDESAETSGMQDFKIKFSFTVTEENLSFEELSLFEYHVYDFDMNEKDNVEISLSNDRFAVNAPNIENLGASVRLNNTPAIRFGAKIDFLPDEIECGMLVGEGENITHNTADVVIYELKKDGELFTTEPVEINSKTKAYTFRPFVRTNSGEYVYYEELSRSAKDVAEFAGKVETDESKKTLISYFLQALDF